MEGLIEQDVFLPSTRPDADYQGRDLVFLVGSPRSGTTWLQRLLASHPSVQTGQESNLFSWYVGPQLRVWHDEVNRELRPETSIGRGGGVGLPCYLEQEEFFAILKDYMLRLVHVITQNVPEGGLFLEKTPNHALFLPEIHELLPESRIIHIVRDARDVTASLLAVSQSWGASWAPDHPRDAAWTWVKHVHAVREAARKLPGMKLCEITYERLWTSPESTLAEVAAFLGLCWSPQEIREAVARNRGEAVKASGGTPIPMHGEYVKHSGGTVKEPKDFVRQAEPGAGAKSLSLWQRLWVWRVAHTTMEEHGYHWPLSDVF